MGVVHQVLLLLKPEGFRGLIETFGMPLVCVLVFAESGVFPVLPGDSLLVVCGMFAAAPVASGGPALPLWLLLGIVPWCAVLGGQVGYGVGRWAGARAYAWKDRNWGFVPVFRRAWLRRTEAFFKRWGSFAVVAGRWVPFVRTFAPLLAGVSRVSYAAFIPYNLLGAFTWVWTMVLTGYYLPPLVDRAFPGFRLEDHIDGIVVAVVLLSLVPVLYTVVKEGRGDALTAGPGATKPAARRTAKRRKGAAL